MLNYTIRRLLLALLVALTVSTAGFLLMNASSDLALTLAGENATREQIEAVRVAYGLDRPLVVQYFEWLSGFLGGDFGQSYYFKQPVADLLLSRLPTTFTLGLVSLLLAVAVALPFGVAAAVWRNSVIDRAALVFTAMGQSMPSFWVGLLVMSYFGITLRLLPISGSATWLHFVLPAATLAFAAQPMILRLTRAGMIEVLSADYIRTANAKGLRPATVLIKHALRNALLPVVAVTAVQLGQLVGGSVVVESIFAIKGIGYLAWESILRNDYPVVQAILVVVSISYVLLTLLSDLMNAALDPRMRTV